MAERSSTREARETVRLGGRETDGIERIGEPVTTGVPFPPGRVRDAGALSVHRADGRPVPFQAEALDRWPDGSVRWALLDLRVDASPRGKIDLEVRPGSPAEPAPPSPPVRVTRTGAGLFVDTGAAQFALDTEAFLPFRSVRARGVEILDPGRSAWSCRDDRDVVWTPAVRETELETMGPLRATIRVHGGLVRPGKRDLLDFVARLHFHAGTASVRFVLTVRNPRRALHRGGHWELGDGGSVLFRDLSLRFAAAGADRVSWSPDPSVPLSGIDGTSLEMYQDSSGGENWRSRTHLTRDRVVPTTFRGYRVRAGDEEREGLRATPRVVVHDRTSGISASMRYFWQDFPKAMETTDGVLVVRLFPDRFAALHELQGGEQKTHEIWLSFGPDAVSPAGDFQRRPLVVHPDPDWFARSGAIPYLTPRRDGDRGLHARLADAAIEGADTFEAKRERADEYGWRNFGEIWADHETKFHDGPETFVSHNNNQYDVVYGAFLQFARSGDLRWYRIFEELAHHVIDIDLYHTDEDRPAYNRGLFWHTAHYVDADLSTHRSYPRRGTRGGGPDDEHNYRTGLLHYHLMTGDPLGREAVLDGARWVIDADDGKGTILRFLDRGPTGLATKTRDFDYHGPGRGAGNSLQVLLDAWRLTGEERYLDKCEEILRRTIHPADDPGSHGLLDAENRWSYTVHLQALGRFLDVMAEAGRLGDSYAYARESLLTYARWMADHERPTLDHAEDLEYPTETWAAQDLRKSDVLLLAALHATGEERKRFLERAGFFYNHSLETLDGFETKSFTRPVALLMSCGHLQAWFDLHPGDARPPPHVVPDFGEPRRFVPQKIAAMRKLRRIAAGGAAVAVAGSAAALARWLL